MSLEKWLQRNDLKLTETGELVVIIVEALGVIAIGAVFILSFIAIADMAGAL